MGAQQSVPGSEHEDPTVATKTCYYELIGVETDATDIECVYLTPCTIVMYDGPRVDLLVGLRRHIVKRLWNFTRTVI